MTTRGARQNILGWRFLDPRTAHRIEVSGLIDIFTDAWFAVEAPRPGLQFDATVEAGLEGIEAAGRNLQ